MSKNRAPFLIGLVSLLTLLISYEQLSGQIVRRRNGFVGVGNRRPFGIGRAGRLRPAVQFPGSRMGMTVQGSLLGRSNYLNTYGSRRFAPPLAGNAVDPYLAGPSMPFRVPYSPLVVPHDGYGAAVANSYESTVAITEVGYAPIYQPLPIGRSSYGSLLGQTDQDSSASGSVFRVGYAYPRASLIPRTSRIRGRNSSLTLPSRTRSTLIIPTAVTPTLYPAPHTNVATSLEPAGFKSRSDSPLFYEPYHSRFLETRLSSFTDSCPSGLIARAASRSDQNTVPLASTARLD